MDTAIDTENVEGILSVLKGLDWRQIASAAAIIVIGLILARLLAKGFGRLLKRTSRIPATLHSMLKTLLRVVLDAAVVITAAGYIGIPITSFVAIMSILGVAISLGVQGLMSNLVGGFIILASAPFQVGDFVESDGITGSVREVGILHTKLLTYDGKLVFIPNSILSNARLINYTVNGMRMVELQISASYASRPADVRAAILDAIDRTETVLKDRAPVVRVESYDDSAIRYTLQAWASSADFIKCKYEINERLYDTFAEHGVTMTYPHLNVHVREDGIIPPAN